MTNNQTPQPQRPFVGAHLLLVQDNQVLLMKRNKGQMKDYYALVAGRVDDFETPSVAMIREAYEEAGITIVPQDLKFLTVMHRPKAHYKGERHDIIEFIFTTEKWQGDIQNMEPHLCDEIEFFDIDNLPNDITKTVKTALQCWRTQTPYFEFEKRD